MRRLSNSIEIARCAGAVLRADKELLLLPVLSGFSSALVAASFLVPLFLASDGGALGAGSYIVMFIMYVALAYVTIFFNAALVDAANDRMNGGDPSLGSALAGARLRAARILPWAIVSATVSVILRAVEERTGIVGQLLAGLAGVAWSVVTFLVLPVIVIEGLGVSDAVRKSSELFRRTWGENLTAQVGFSLLGVVAMVPAIVIVIAAASLGGGAALVAIAAAVLWGIVVAVVLAALGVVFQTALYHFATAGHVPGDHFRAIHLSGAFAAKGR